VLPSTATFQVTKVPFGTVELNNLVYNGADQIPTIKTPPLGEVLVFVTEPATVRNVGTYTVTSFTSANYTYTLPVPARFQITKALYPVTLALDGANATFDNTPHYVTVNTSTPASEAVTFTYTKSVVTTPVSHGTYSISATSQNYNYTISLWVGYLRYQIMSFQLLYYRRI
jgi:hypothetical protein